MSARSDLLRALRAGLSAEPSGAISTSDEEIRERLTAELARRPWWQPMHSWLTVKDAVVHVWGGLEHDEERDALRVAAESIPGVRGVEDHRYRMHDMALRI